MDAFFDDLHPFAVGNVVELPGAAEDKYRIGSDKCGAKPGSAGIRRH